MTLILTALCKNGISICADKRSKRQYDNGNVEIRDDLNKIYKLDNSGVVICNHGVNEIMGKSWVALCTEYEKLKQWKSKDEFWILNDFKTYIENDVSQQLEVNFQHDRLASTAIGFIVCGKTNFDSKFKINELFWSFDLSGIHFELKRHYGLVRTGSGSNYLDEYIRANSYIDTVDYWKNMNASLAEQRLRELFAVAVKKKRDMNGEEISDNCSIISI